MTMRFFRTLSRSVSVAAAFAAAVALLPTAAHAAGGVLVVSHQPYGTPVLDMGDVDMGTTGVGQQTEVVLVVGNTGDEEIEITSVSVSAGFNIESSVTGPLFPDFTKALRISCDATEATPGSDPLVGTVGITSTNPGDSLFVVHLWCRVVGGAQNGTLAVADEDIITFVRTHLGANTAGKWRMNLDGSTVPGMAAEDVNAYAVLTLVPTTGVTRSRKVACCRWTRARRAWCG